MGDVNQPWLPDGMPADLRAFFDCTSMEVRLKSGPLEWLPGSPPLEIKPGAKPGTATIKSKFLGFNIELPATLGDGALTVTVPKSGPSSYLPESVPNWFNDVNAWFKHNGKGWGQPVFDKDGVTLKKVVLAPTGKAAQPAPPVFTPVAPKTPPKPATPPPPPEPKTDYGPNVGDVSAIFGTSKPTGQHLPGEGSAPPPYQETKVEQPTIRNKEAFAPDPNPKPLEDMQTGGSVADYKSGSGQVVGAGGPGGAKAPAGMGTLARYGFVAVLVAALAGAVLFGSGALNGGPAASGSSHPSSDTAAGESSGASAGASAGPGESGPAPSYGEGTPSCSGGVALADLFDGAGDEEALCRLFLMDARGDGIEYNGKPVAVQAAAGDIVATALAKVQLSPQLAALLAGECGQDMRLHCAEMKPAAGAYVLYAVQLATPAAQTPDTFYEVAFGWYTNTTGGAVGKAPWAGSGPGDPLKDHNKIFTLRFASVASGAGIVGPFMLGYDSKAQTPFFAQVNSGAFTFVEGDVVVGAIPVGEIGDATTYRFFTYAQKDDNTVRAVDLDPDLREDIPHLPADLPVILQ